MTIAEFYRQHRRDGRAVIAFYASGEPKTWITRVEGMYFACHSEAVGIREVRSDMPMALLEAFPSGRPRVIPKSLTLAVM